MRQNPDRYFSMAGKLQPDSQSEAPLAKNYLQNIVVVLLIIFLSILSSHITEAYASVMFSDDFNDNSIDPAKWTVITGNTVTESIGMMVIDQAVTDNGGNLNSRWLDINTNNILTITRRVNVHYANNYYVGKLGIVFDQAFYLNIEYAQMSWGNYPYCSSYGIYIVKNSSTHMCPPQSDISPRIEPVWDQWFDEKIVYNPLTGVLEYFINNQKRTEFNVGALPAGTNKMQLYFNSWGWWTGHYHYFDDIVVQQGGVVDLPRTGQTTCYDSAGAVIACAGTGQDGEIQAGVPWPNPRFKDNTDGTVTDNLTGLMWTQDGNAPGPVACFPATTKTWQGALDYVACLNANSYLGYTDWRLPNINELRSVAHAGQVNTATWLNMQGFNNVQSYSYWSSTSLYSYPDSASVVFVSYGSVGFGNKSFYFTYVWPVRSGQVGLLGSSVIQLPRTGQTTCYNSAGALITCTGTGQDGEIQAGVPWPNSRFIDNGNGTVTDNLTGLMWSQDGNAPGPVACSAGTYKTWQGALDYMACLNANSYLGYNDWRLPNVHELRSVAHAGQVNTATWLNMQGFNNVQSNYYWSSTSFANLPDSARSVRMWYGYVGNDSKSTNNYVWPVRFGHVDPCVTITYYRDADGDGFGDAAISTQACTPPSGYVSNNTDCNDINAAINPAAAEVCNGIDDNCNTQIDEGVQNTYYQDADGDLYGNASVSAQACTVLIGYASDNTDCNDSNAAINPSAAEVCGNGVDDNCNVQIDEGCTLPADLSVTITDLPDPITPAGQDVTYTITVTNNGPAYASGVTVTDVLDANLTLVSATPSQGAPCTGTGTITCNLGSMISGASATVTIVATTSTTPGMIGSTASVAAAEPDPNTSNNTASQTTNVGDVSREVGISTRGYVETGTNIMVGGFSFGGTVSKKVLIRGRGPSMSGAPYNFTGTLTNPILEIYSGATLFATVDDWQAGATMCNAPAENCGTPAELLAALTDPCQPNAGQTTAPPGCMQEAALYITLPPGAYTVKLKGVLPTDIGKGIMEVYDADTTSLTMLGGISTRGKVMTGTDVMVGGFIVGAGTTNKTLLLRGRGPSLSGAPYNFTGTLTNPLLEVYSGPTLFATVDDWQSGATMCNAPAISCGTPAQLQTALVDPCQPNVGQITPPLGCMQESAMFITLPPGAYTTKLKGVNNDTGIGIFEVYEINP